MAQAAVKGAQKVGAEVRLVRVEETLSQDILEKMGAVEAQKVYSHVPIATPDDLAWADGSIWLSPTRFGNVATQMKMFMDRLGGLWMSGALVGKVAGAMSSSSTQHGGNEVTITSGFWPFFAHMGMIIVGLPYSYGGQMGLEEIKGGSPYGASTITGADGSRLPSANELSAAEFQAEHITKIATVIAGGKNQSPLKSPRRERKSREKKEKKDKHSDKEKDNKKERKDHKERKDKKEKDGHLKVH
jgi:NAD(P)H dehydrogenase (quinone)